MRGAISWMVGNHVAANLLMLIFLLGGLLKIGAIKQEVFPEVDLDRVQVFVAYPGAGPEEVEDGIILRIEDNLTGVDGIKQIKSVAREGSGMVTVELLSGADIDLVLQDVKSEVDRIITFPEEAEKPVISKLLNRREVISVVVYGELDDLTLRELAEDLQDDLLDYAEITQVDLSGVRPYEISVEIAEEELRRHRVTLSQVARRLREASQDIPGGLIKSGGHEILLRTKERRYYGPEYEQLVILSGPDGSRVRLSEIAQVRDGFAETDQYARFDGEPAGVDKAGWRIDTKTGLFQTDDSAAHAAL